MSAFMLVRSNWKYVILFLLFLGWSLGNLDRFIINYAILDISKDLHLNASSTGIILSSFFAGYALMQIPGGWLADRFGFKKVITIAVLLWSLFTVFTGMAWSFASIIIIRFLFGLGEGSYFPSASKGIAGWFPQQERSRAMSFLLSSGTIMGVVTPILATQLMQTISWRSIFYIIGAIGLVITVLLVFLLKEKKQREKTETSAIPAKQMTLKEIIKTPMIWNLFIAYFSIYAINWGLMSWMPTYLAEVRHLNLTDIGFLSAIPAFVGIIGMFVSGFVLDKLPDGKDKTIAAVFGLLMGIFLCFMAISPSVGMFIVFQSAVTLLFSFNVILIASAPLKMLPESVVGSANGFINTGAQAAGVLTPMLIGFLVQSFGGSYNAAFALLIICALVCAISLFSIRPAKVVVDAQNAVK